MKQSDHKVRQNEKVERESYESKQSGQAVHLF